MEGSTLKFIKDEMLNKSLISEGRTFAVIKEPKSAIEDLENIIQYGFPVEALKKAFSTMENLLKNLKNCSKKEMDLTLWILKPSDEKNFAPCIIMDAKTDDFAVSIGPQLPKKRIKELK